MSRSKLSTADIAREAGVSPATVSRVINHRDLVRPETAAHVESVMQAMGFAKKQPAIPSPDDKKVILVNCPQGTNPFYEEIIRGMITSAEAHGYFLVLNYDHIHPGSIGNFINLIKRINASGVILLSCLSEELLILLHDVVPIVQCCEFNADADFPYVSIDDHSAASQAVNYLISAHRNKIAFINGPGHFKYARERLRGYLDAMSEAELSVPSDWILQIPQIDYNMAYSAVSQLLSSDELPNAFFAASDVFAAAIINAARKYGLRIPEDIMVVGFDNISISQMVRPTITTVNQPKLQLGYSACELLSEIIIHPKSAAKSIMLSTELIIRESAAN